MSRYDADRFGFLTAAGLATLIGQAVSRE